VLQSSASWCHSCASNNAGAFISYLAVDVRKSCGPRCSRYPNMAHHSELYYACADEETSCSAWCPSVVPGCSHHDIFTSSLHGKVRQHEVDGSYSRRVSTSRVVRRRGSSASVLKKTFSCPSLVSSLRCLRKLPWLTLGSWPRFQKCRPCPRRVYRGMQCICTSGVVFVSVP
jgi:hypothetical protein